MTIENVGFTDLWEETLAIFEQLKLRRRAYLNGLYARYTEAISKSMKNGHRLDPSERPEPYDPTPYWELVEAAGIRSRKDMDAEVEAMRLHLAMNRDLRRMGFQTIPFRPLLEARNES